MTENFVNQSTVSGLPMPANESLVTSASNMSWQQSGSKGFLLKPLFEDQDSPMRTWLMKVESGAYVEMHSHNELEQIYVIEGTFYDQNGQYKAGDYIIRAAGVPHTAGSEEGALVLLFYST